MRLMGPAKRRPVRCMAAVSTDKSHSPTSGATPSPFAQTLKPSQRLPTMAALTSSQMMVAAPVVAKAGAASKAKAVAPRRAGVVSFSAKLGVSNGTEQKTNAFYIWKSQGNKCVHAGVRGGRAAGGG